MEDQQREDREVEERVWRVTVATSEREEGKRPQQRKNSSSRDPAGAPVVK